MYLMLMDNSSFIGVSTMYDKTITIFNLDAQNSVWHKTIIEGCDAISTDGYNLSSVGLQNISMLSVLVNCNWNKIFETTEGNKQFLDPKVYKDALNKEAYVTFNSDTDFIVLGEITDEISLNDEDYDSGLYNYVNKTYDNVYLINSYTYYSLIPHYEVGCR